MEKELFDEPEIRVESFQVQENIMDTDWEDIGEGSEEETEVSFPDEW